MWLISYRYWGSMRIEEIQHFINFFILALLLHPLKIGLCIGILVGITDEIIQHLLPNRVGDFKDVYLNVGCFLVAYCVLRLVYKNKPT